ncbi:MAG: hydroxymethylglutaryl-CoA lyase [Legionella sp.]
MNFPRQVTITEVGPRDGLQNEPIFVNSDDKIAFINLLADSGLRHIEATSFVSAKQIPQLADADLVYRTIIKPDLVHFSALVANHQGMLKALDAGVKEIALFTAASETFNQYNINCSITESIQRFIPIIQLAKKHCIRVRAYISCALGCPYEGKVLPPQVERVTQQLLELHVDEISLADTIGVGTPQQTVELIEYLKLHLPLSMIAMHFHDTYGQGIANTYAALLSGISKFDSSVAGLGGCPYAQGASGNIATEDILYLLHGLNITTGIDIYKIVRAGEMICKILGRKNQSKVANALLLNSNQ